MNPQSISDVLRLIYAHVPGDLAAQTLDTVKLGDPSQPVCGIVTCFLASYAVLERAAALGANLIITHEPTFYNHLDETAWLEDDAVYCAKKALIEAHQMVVWRFHDGMHHRYPDAILSGVAQKLGWQLNPDPALQRVFSVEPQTVRALANRCKERLGIQKVRVAGNLDALCRRVGVLEGAWGGKAHLEFFKKHDIDVLLCGETQEWETCEYIRDANAQGKAKALIVLGHGNSEDAGMERFTEWLRSMLPPTIAVTHVKTGDPFQFV